MLDWLLGGAAVTRPTSRYLGLSLGTPSSVSGSEGSWSGYTRQALAFGAASTVASSGTAINTAALTFSANAAVTATPVRGYEIWDTNLGTNSGNMLFYGQLSASSSLVSGDTLSFASGAIVISLS